MQVTGMTTQETTYQSQLSTMMSKIWDTTKKVAKVASGALLDFADGYVRANSVVVGVAGALFTATIIGAPIGIPLMIGGYFVYKMSAAYLSPAAGSCYESAGQNANSPLRWIPYLAGVSVAILSTSGGGAAAAA